MWQGLETEERRALANLSIHFVQSHINSIFTVNTPILYLSCNNNRMLFNVIIIQKDNRNPISMVVLPPIHGILNPNRWYFDPPYPWYFDPPAHLLK